MHSKAAAQLEKEKTSRGDARSTNKQTMMEKQVNILVWLTCMQKCFYRVILEESSILWEVIVSVIANKYYKHVSNSEWLLRESCLNLLCTRCPSLFSDALDFCL